MSRIFLIDDDSSITDILSMIIAKRNLGEVCGTSNNPVEALDDVLYEKPDIVIVDLLMPEMDGITFIRKASGKLPGTAFIMLSQVSSKDMVADAYEAGCEFFIQKPINSIEVEKVIANVSESMKMRKTMKQMENLFRSSMGIDEGGRSAARETGTADEPAFRKEVGSILDKLGIAGESGFGDIVNVAVYVRDNPDILRNDTLKQVCEKFSDTPKSMEQRIRRAAQSGLSNLAHMGIEDYGNPVFDDYASSLYSYEQVKREMDYIRGKSDIRGGVKIKKFISALVSKSQEYL